MTYMQMDMRETAHPAQSRGACLQTCAGLKGAAGQGAAGLKPVSLKPAARTGFSGLFKPTVLAGLLVLLPAGFNVPPTWAADLDIANIPLVVGGSQEPNLMILIDNSAAMHWGHTPANAERYVNSSGNPGNNNPFYWSAHINKVYYDPMVKYSPPYDVNGVQRANIDFEKAPRDAYGVESPDPDTTSNLGTSFRTIWYIGLANFTDALAQPAFYFRYDENLTGCKHTVTTKAYTDQVVGMDFYYMGFAGSGKYSMSSTQVDDYAKCFQKVRVGVATGGNTDTTRANAASATGIYVADKDEFNHPDNQGSADKKKQNFANWYSYYRIRVNTVKSVLSNVMRQVSPNMRVGFGVTGNGGGSGDNFSASGKTYHREGGGGANAATAKIDGSDSIYSIHRGVRPFKDFPDNSGVDPTDYRNKKFKTEFYQWLFALKSRQGGDVDTAGHLRRAVDAAGRYYVSSKNTTSNTGINSRAGGAWSVNPGVEDSPVLACRRSYTLLVTSGQNTGNAVTDNVGLKPLVPGVNWNHPAGYDIDGNYGPEITNVDAEGNSYAYVPDLPFSDGAVTKNSDGRVTNVVGSRNGTLADIALYYWYQSLLPQATAEDAKKLNKVPPSGVDYATWPHMNLMVLGMGNMVDVDRETVMRAAYLGTPLPSKWGYNDTQTWGNPDAGTREGLPESYQWPDDLLHATINSRGAYYDTTNPEELVITLNQAMDAIRTDKVISARVAVNSGSVKNPPLTYQAMFNSDWQTNLKAYRTCTGEEVFLDGYTDDTKTAHKSTYEQNRSCNAEGDLWATASWNALDKLRDKIGSGVGDSRNIKTWGGTAGKDFEWDSLSQAQKDSISKAAGVGEQIVKYIRGDGANEGENTGQFRAREGKVLGDIVNAALLFVGNDDFGYANAQGMSKDARAAYRERKRDNAYRQEVLYAAANDGMLHAFNADDCDPLVTGGSCQGGEELFAYVPAGVIHKLDKLASTSYKHEFYVDGSPAVNDAFLDGAWKTVLVGSTGAGGRSYFALDIERPDAFNENSVLWERTGGYVDNTNPDKNIAPDAGFGQLGVTIGQATVAYVNNTWVAVFGNGYNSPGHTARLFVVNLQTGALIAEIDTKVGDAANPNGLSTPIVVDVDRDGIADLAYAGDLWGNLWRFNLQSLTLEGSLLKAEDASTPPKAQPITAKPEVARHKDGGLMVYVGTGKFFGTTDKTDKQVQTFYGVRDNCAVGSACAVDTVTRDKLLQQKVETQKQALFCEQAGAAASKACGDSETVRVISDNKKTQGQADYGFYLDLISSGTKLGERITAAPIIWSDRVIFNTIEPSDDECDPLGDGWLYEIDPFTGGRTEFSVFDLAQTGSFNATLDGKVVSAKKVGMGGGVVARGTNKYVGNTKGSVQKVANNPRHMDKEGRQSWRQVH